jgi:thioesterase domain-containing protein/acyl carrier protein
MAVEFRNRLQKTLGIALPASLAFDLPNLKQLCSHLAAKILRTENFTVEKAIAEPLSIQMTDYSGDIPLSYGQERLWQIAQQGTPKDQIVYNIPLCLSLKGQLDIESLKQSFITVVGRHEIYRTSVVEKEGRGIQVIHPLIDWNLPIVDFSRTLNVGEQNQQVIQLIDSTIQAPFSLDEKSLWRACLITLSEEEHILVIVWHHIISDGGSILLTLKEIESLYQSDSTPLPETLQYRDYAIWQRNWLTEERILNSKHYWRRQLAGELQTLQLPLANTDTLALSYQGAKETLEIPEAITQKLKKVSQKEEITLSSLLLSCFQVLLYCYTGQRDILVSIPVSGRNYLEFQNVLGYFNNIIPIRIQLTGSMTLREVLQQVRQVTLDSLQHADIPFQWIPEIAEVRGVNLSQALFDYEVFPDTPLSGLGVDVKYLPCETKTSNFNLGFFIKERGRSLYLSLEYKLSVLDKDKATKILKNYAELIAVLEENLDVRISELRPALNIPLNESLSLKAGRACGVSPRNEIEKTLVSIWEEVLHVQGIGVEDNFFECGGNSLLAVELAKKLNKTFNQSILLSDIATASSIEKQASLLQKNMPATQTLVALQTKGSGIPLFAFHPAFGDVFAYRELANLLGTNQPFYGLQAKWLFPHEKPLLTIQDMAADFIQSIRLIQPHGPYQFLGHSGGGFIAYEAAQQLLQSGEEVKHLIILDLAADVVYAQSKQLKEGRILYMLDIPLQVFREYEKEASAGEASIRRQFLYPLRAFWFIKNVILPSQKGRDILRPAIERYMSHLKPYPGKLTLIRSRQTDDRYTLTKTDDMGWNQFALGGVDVIKVSGSHHNMLRSPHVKEIADYIKQLLAESSTYRYSSPA